ncbi:MAG: DinB family protein [Actinomycetota bacterium]
MNTSSIRPAFSVWPHYDQRLREVVAGLTVEQLAFRPSSERWPLWATIGHTACQRVFWLCDFAGEPGAETTRFTNAAYDCPGDDDLEQVLDPEQLAEALSSTFRIVEGCLDRWTPGVLDEDIRREDFGEEWVHTRGWVIQRVFSHDVYHCAELNEAFAASRLPQIDLWGPEGSE